MVTQRDRLSQESVFLNKAFSLPDTFRLDFGNNFAFQMLNLGNNEMFKWPGQRNLAKARMRFIKLAKTAMKW